MSYIYISGTSTVSVPNSIPTGGTISTDVYGLAVKVIKYMYGKQLLYKGMFFPHNKYFTDLYIHN